MELKENSGEFDHEVNISINSDAGVETQRLSDIVDECCSAGLVRRLTTPRSHSSLVPLSPPVGVNKKSSVCHSKSSSSDFKRHVFFADRSTVAGTFPARNKLTLSYDNGKDQGHASDSEPEIDLTLPYDNDKDQGHASDSEPEIDLNYSPTTIDNSIEVDGCSKSWASPVTTLKQQESSSSSSSTNRSKPSSPGIRSTFQARYLPPTKLHELCDQAQTVEDLKQARSVLLKLNLPRKEILNFSTVTDGRGRTPLHLISENKNIPENLGGSNTADIDVALFPDIVSDASHEDDPSHEMIVENFILGFLFAANPSAAMSRDNDGKIPFERSIEAWVNQCHDEMLHSNRSTNRRDSLVSAQKAVFNAIFFSVSKSARRSEAMMKSPDVTKGSDLQLGLNQGLFSGRKEKPAGTKEGVDRKKCFPVHVRLSCHVVFALKILSAILERLEKLSSRPSRSSRDKTPTGLMETDSFDRVMDESFSTPFAYNEIKESIVSSIASIPNFVKLVFLVDSDEDREFALSTTIMRRVLLNKHSVGSWLPAMLKSENKRVSDRAVDYLNLVSELAAEEKTSSQKSKSSSNMSRTERRHEDLCTEISYMQDFVPSLMALGEKKMGEAATSMVVRRVMDRFISRPFAVTIFLADAMFLFLLIFGFRTAVNNLLVRGNESSIMGGIYIANTGIFYFIIREIGKVISLRMVTRRTRDYLWSFWNLTDLSATVFSLVSILSIRSISKSGEGLDIVEMHGFRNFLAITTGLLWFRVLNLLKGINMQMATFILAILQITKDTLSFGVILCAMVVAFGQMFYTVLVPAYCSNEESVEDPGYRCDQSEYLFGAYTVLLGDFGAFERENFQTTFSLLMLLFYSFLVIIVLLNVLIAVGEENTAQFEVIGVLLKDLTVVPLISIGLVRKVPIAIKYVICLLSKCSEEKGHELRRESRSSVSKDNWWFLSSSFAKGWSHGSVVFFCLSSLVIVIWAIGEMAGYFSGDQRYGNVGVSLVSVIVNILVFAAMMVLYQRAEKMTSERSQLGQDGNDESEKPGWLDRLQKMMLRFIGSSQDSWNKKQDLRTDNEWRGRVHHLQSRMDRMAQEANERSLVQAQNMEQLLAANELRFSKEMEEMTNRLETLHSDCLMQLKQSQDLALKQIQECLLGEGRAKRE